MFVTRRVLLWIVTILTYLKSFTLATIPKPETVLVPVPFNQLENIQWSSGPGLMESTCGTYRAYSGTMIKKVTGRWYTMFVSNIHSQQDQCGHFANVKKPCECMGIDFATAVEDGLISFVMFSTNSHELSVAYEVAMASVDGEKQLNMNRIVLRSFKMQPNTKITSLGGYLIPNGVVVETDNFESYMIMLFCEEGGIKPVVLVLVNALPMGDDIKAKAIHYIMANGLTADLLMVNHNGCGYAQKIIGS